MKKIAILLLFISNSLFAQIVGLEDLPYLINDAVFYSNKYITPAADGAIYQASSGWITSPKKRKLWAVTLGFNNNIFFVPNSDREFTINNSDLTFFTLYDANWQEITSASVPTAVGNNQQVNLVGNLGANQVYLKTPQGVNSEVVYYPHFNGSVSLWFGTELIVKYSPVTKLKSGNFQVYGFGVKHNFDQYFNYLKQNKINISGLLCYSNENISFDFIPPVSNGIDLGINAINGLVDTWQIQFNASKEYKRFEIITGIIANLSDVKYEITGPKGDTNIQDLFNLKLKEIYKTKTNFLGEISCRYKINKMYLQSTFAFGKFVNSNIAVQYEF